MNETELVGKARNIVGRHPLPDFIKGFDVEFAEFDGDGAIYVIYKTDRLSQSDISAAERRVPEIIALERRVMNDLLQEFDAYFPYFRYKSAAGPETAQE